MLTVALDRFGFPEVLVPRERPEAGPTPGWVRVRVEMRTVNVSDLEIPQGNLRNMMRWLPLRFPAVLGSNLVGTLMDMAPDLAAGARVAGRTPTWCSRHE